MTDESPRSHYGFKDNEKKLVYAREYIVILIRTRAYVVAK